MTSVSLTALLLLTPTAADNPCLSGIQPGQRPAPYAPIVCTGSERGKPHCFICETADRPAVIIFARQPTDALGKLVQGIDKAVLAQKDGELRAWVTFISADQQTLDPTITKWGKQQGIGNVPLTIFEDLDGPPAYRLTRDAEVVVLLSVKQKVVHNFAFRAGELNDGKTKQILDALPAILKK